MRHRTIGRLVCPILVAMLAFAVAGCNQETSAPLASLQALPEANLPIMPGATLIHQQSSSRFYSLDGGWTGAMLSRTFGMHEAYTAANEHAVIDYYTSLLEERGWTDTCGGLCWKKGGSLVRLNFNPVTSSLDPQYEQGYGFVFDESLQEDLNK
jgi:hypothetical protein